MRLVFPVLFVLLWISGCTFFTETNHTSPPILKLSNSGKYSRNFNISGRILFKHPEGKHNGEFLMQISGGSEMKMRIFAPIIGSLIYELRVGPENFLILNYQDKNYALRLNSWEARKNWLGMDLLVEELRWLIIGRLPEKIKFWKRKILPTGEWQLTQKNTKIHISFNSNGYIESMNKSIEGFLEYKAKILQYKKANELFFPNKIQIEDYTGNNLWMMYIKEINPVSDNIDTIVFDPPTDLEKIQ